MAPSFERRLTLTTIAAALCAATAAGVAGYLRLSDELNSSALRRTEQAGALLAARAADQLRSAIEQARLLTNDMASPLPAGGDVIGLRVIRLPEAFGSATKARGDTLSWTTQKDSGFASSDFDSLDTRFPIALDRIADGSNEVTVGSTPKIASILRVGLPFGRKGRDGYSQALVAEIKPAKILAALDPSAFVTTREGILLAGSTGTPRQPGDDVSKVAVLSWARTQGVERGSTENSDRYSSFERINVDGLTLWVIAESPHAPVTRALISYAASSAAAALLIGLLFAPWAVVLTQRGFTAPLRSLRKQLDAALSARGAPAPIAALPDEKDEIELMADSLEAVFNELESSRALAPATPPAALSEPALAMAPSPASSLPDPTVPTPAPRRPASGAVPAGRGEGFVLCARTYGLDTDFAKFDEVLNDYLGEVTQAISDNEGIAMVSAEGAVFGYWKVANPSPGSLQAAHAAARALAVCQAIRESSLKLAYALESSGSEPPQLSMALHFGALTSAAGTLMGEAPETAARVGTFVDQFGTDLMLTASAAQRLPPDQAAERVTSGDDQTPELYELAIA
jgi:HAMP domain-containing protein